MEWNKIIAELNDVKSKLEMEKSQEKSPKKSEDSRINILTSQKAETDEILFNNYRKKID